MTQFVPAGIKLVAVGVTSFQQSMNIANNARQQFTSGLQQANASKFNSDLRDMATAAVATAVGIGLMTTALAEFIASTSGFASVQFAAQVERDAKFMQAVLQATDADMKKLLSTAESLGANIPTAFRDIITQIRELGRAGIDIDAITSSVARLSSAVAILAKGEASPQKVAEGLSAMGAAFAKPGDDIEKRTELLERSAKAIVGVANATRLSIPEVLNAFTKSAPVGGIFGVTIEQLGAFIALVGAAGIRGEEAGTGIRNFFLRMANPSKDAAEQMEKYNLSFFDVLGNARPVVDVLSDLVEVYGEEAIALGKITPAQRAYSLNQIFQTRTAAVAALAIIQTDSAYNHYLQTIAETDPIIQAAQATDNLLDRIEVLKNRVIILGNTFGAAILPGLRTFVNSINDTIGDVSQPGNRARQAAGALGQGLGSLFTGEGVGQAADQLEAQFGNTVGNLFEAVAEQAGRVRDVILGELVPAVGAFFDTLRKISVDTVFNPGAVRTFGDAIVEAISFTAGLVRIFGLFLEGINTLRPVAVSVFGAIGSAVGAVSSAIGTFLSETVAFFVNVGNVLADMAKEFEFFQQFAGSSNPALQALAQFSNMLDRTSSVVRVFTTDAQGIQKTFDGIGTRIQEANTKLQDMMQNERNIRQIASSTRAWEQELRRLQEIQLADEGPDVSDQIEATQRTIDAFREQMRVMSGVVDADDAVAEAIAKVKAAYDEWQASMAKTEGQYDNQLEAGRREAQQKKEIETATRRLAEIYEDLGISASRAVRELGDRVDDLVTKTNRALSKLATDTQDRIDEVRRNLEVASRDAEEAFDFETSVRNQRLAVTQMFEDINTAIGRTFDTQRRALSDSIEDRERIRQRDTQLVQDALQRQVDDNIRANSEINEDYQQSLSRRNEDLQRALSRAHQLQTEQLQATFDAQNTQRSRTNEDASRQRQLSRDLAKAKTEEERRSIRERFQEETTTIGERRQLETQEANIRKQQEKQLQDLRLKQENETLNVTRSLAKQELDIRRQLASEERDFRLQQEFALLFARVAIEEQFIRETRRLREGVDIPAQQRLEDRQTGARRQVGTQETVFEDFFRLEALAREQFLRERQADRQEEDIVRDKTKREIEILEGFDEDAVRIIREFLQKMADLQGQAMNSAADMLRRIGVDFPALQQFRGSLPGLFGSATAQGQGITGNLRDRLNVPALPVPGGNIGALTQQQLSLIPAAAISARFSDLGIQLNALTTVLREKTAIGGVNVTIDDINLGNSIIIGVDGVARLGSIISTAAARTIAPIGGQ